MIIQRANNRRITYLCILECQISECNRRILDGKHSSTAASIQGDLTRHSEHIQADDIRYGYFARKIYVCKYSYAIIGVRDASLKILESENREKSCGQKP